MRKLLIGFLLIPSLVLSQIVQPIAGRAHLVREAGSVTFVEDLQGGPQKVYPVNGTIVIYKGHASYADVVNSGVVGGVVYYASDFGFHPDSSAALNVSAWNSIGAADTVYIDVVGIYDINNTLWLESNTTYVWTAGSTVRKATGSSFSHIFGNKGMLTLTRNSGIKFYGNGLRLQVNGIDTYSMTDTDISPVLRLRAHFQFFKVDNFIIDDWYIDDGGTQQFNLCFCDCTFGDISNIDITGSKDGIDVISCTDLNFTNYTNHTTLDDAIFIGVGYAATTPYIGNTERITFDSVTHEAYTATGGFGARIFNASWAVWQSGNTYNQNEYCVHNGRIYANQAAGAIVAANAPVHTSGMVAGADGLEWWYVQDGTITEANVDYVTFKNVDFNTLNRTAYRLSPNYVTPGTEGNSTIDNLVFDNISFSGTYDKIFLYHSTDIGKITVKNTDWTGHVAGNAFYSALVTIGTCTIDELEIDTCLINVTTGTFLSTSVNASASFGKITGVGSTFTRTGLNSILLDGRTNALNVLDNTFTNCQFNISFLYKTNDANTNNLGLTLTNCQFIGSLLKYVFANTVTGCTLLYTSTGTTYYDPAEDLFFNNQATSSVSINVSNSTGTITPAKVLGGGYVTVIACDIPY